MFDENTDFDINRSFEYLDKEYCKAVEDLAVNLQKAETNKKKKDMFNHFAEKYTVIPPLWYYFFRKIEGIYDEKDPRYYPLHLRATSDFYGRYLLFLSANKEAVKIQNLRNYFSEFAHWTKCFSRATDEDNYFSIEQYPKRCLDNRPFAMEFFEEFITFPHQELEEAYKKLEQYSDHPVSKELIKKYKTAKELIIKWNVQEFEYDWIQHTFEFGLRYAIQTFEAALSFKYHRVEIWKKYINSLKSKNIKVMLQVMLKYIRLFVSDIEMKENYERELSEAKSIPGYDDLPDLQSYLFDEPFITANTSKCLFINYFTHHNNLREQHLPFKWSLVNYVLKNVDPLILHKIQKTCRYFCSDKAIPVCHQLVLSSKFSLTRYDTHSLKVKVIENGHVDDTQLFEAPAQIFNNLYISNRLCIKTKISVCVSKLIPKLYKCDARFVELYGQNLTWNEFDFLTSSEKLKNLIFDYTTVYENEQNKAPLEDVVEKLSFSTTKSIFEAHFIYDESKWDTIWPVLQNSRQQLRSKFKDQLVQRNVYYCARIDLDFG